ncbi:MAG: hypothetical protein IJ165_09595, partial [Proteobacteria bacterium]|nr:hypothetical protein [Pseudomonadota bacterium]
TITTPPKKHQQSSPKNTNNHQQSPPPQKNTNNPPQKTLPFFLEGVWGNLFILAQKKEVPPQKTKNKNPK